MTDLESFVVAISPIDLGLRPRAGHAVPLIAGGVAPSRAPPRDVRQTSFLLGCVGELARPARLAHQRCDRAGRLAWTRPAEPGGRVQPRSLRSVSVERGERRDCGVCSRSRFRASAQTLRAGARRRMRDEGARESARVNAVSRRRCKSLRRGSSARGCQAAPDGHRGATVRVHLRTPPSRSRKTARSSEAPKKLVRRSNAPAARLEPPLNDWNPAKHDRASIQPNWQAIACDGPSRGRASHRIDLFSI